MVEPRGVEPLTFSLRTKAKICKKPFLLGIIVICCLVALPSFSFATNGFFALTPFKIGFLEHFLLDNPVPQSSGLVVLHKPMVGPRDLAQSK